MGARIANISVHEIIPPIMPYIIWCVIVLLLIVYVPEISTFLPHLLAR